VATWSQPSNPTPLAAFPGFFTRLTVSDGTTTSSMPFSVVDFDGEAEENGGLIIAESNVESTGVQIYTGSEAAPIFSPADTL
jgi:hypothetical protein